MTDGSALMESQMGKTVSRLIDPISGTSIQSVGPSGENGVKKRRKRRKKSKLDSVKRDENGDSEDEDMFPIDLSSDEDKETTPSRLFITQEAHRKDFMMGKSKEIFQDRKLIVVKHFDGNGSRRVSKMLNVPVNTVGIIIRKWKENQFTINQQRSGAPRKIPVRGVQRIIRRVRQEPRTTRAELQEDLVSTECHLSTLCHNPNAQAAKSIAKRHKYKWRDVTVREMYHYNGKLALIIDYWRQSGIFTVPFSATIMSRDRYRTISWNVHMSHPDADKEKDRKRGTSEHDRKVKPLMDTIRKTCKAIYHPRRHLAVDERMVGCKANTNYPELVIACPIGSGCHGTVMAESAPRRPGWSPSPPGGTLMAGQAMVCRSGVPTRGPSMENSSQEGSPLAGGRNPSSPPPRVVEAVAPERAQFIVAGLSTEVVETLLHSRAPSMRRSYAAQWRLFTASTMTWTQLTARSVQFWSFYRNSLLQG
ncbi:hypothetical protein C0J45_23092 [Silurus meridionalis]|nr:hypothetical protein C0J45_23092 [Silurus meridionalis]